MSNSTGRKWLPEEILEAFDVDINIVWRMEGGGGGNEWGGIGREGEVRMARYSNSPTREIVDEIDNEIQSPDAGDGPQSTGENPIVHDCRVLFHVNRSFSLSLSLSFFLLSSCESSLNGLVT